MPISNTRIHLSLALFILAIGFNVHAQQVTGIWKGKISKKNVEVKIIQKGDSLTGTAYYYESPASYRRYTIRGFFDPNTNSVVWWDDQLVSLHGNRNSRSPLLSVADFNCPGGGVMKLDGSSSSNNDREHPDGQVHLTKMTATSFPDEWDPVIDNYMLGYNDPFIIDSVARISSTDIAPQQNEVVITKQPETAGPPLPSVLQVPEDRVEIKSPLPPAIASPQTMEEKFRGRDKKLTREILVTGDSVELRFYDNAEIDGDSISLFLNDKMIFTHIRLTDKAYTIRLAVNDLAASNELVMVAENLGAIPPNTSYMVAIVGDKRYEATLASTENSSAMIRLVKER